MSGALQVKICGVCSAADAVLVDEAGADYVGIILSAGFRRSRTLREAATIAEAVSEAQRVGVFVDEAPGIMLDARRALSLDVLQLHGGESVAAVRALRERTGATIWKAIRPRTAEALVQLVAEFAPVADAILLDGWSAAAIGGAGVRADWSGAAGLRDRLPAGTHFVLAGGLDPRNVEEAVQTARPHIVDVSSGVESESGRKSAELVRAFIAAARGATEPAGKKLR